MTDEKPPGKLAGFLVALVPLALGVWMLLTPYALDDYDPHGRNLLFKKIVSWIWGYPGGVVLVLIGLLLLWAAFLPAPPAVAQNAVGDRSALPSSPKTATPPPLPQTGDSNPADLLKEIPAMAETHVKMAHDNFDVVLDYTEASLGKIDEIVSKHWDEPPVFLDQVVMAFGAYVGETIRRLKGGRWEYDEERGYNLVGMGGTDFRINPFAKVRKRFVHGDEDSIAYYYQVICKLIEDQKAGRIPGGAAPGEP